MSREMFWVPQSAMLSFDDESADGCGDSERRSSGRH